jgi:hypothetical protein
MRLYPSNPSNQQQLVLEASKMVGTKLHKRRFNHTEMITSKMAKHHFNHRQFVDSYPNPLTSDSPYGLVSLEIGCPIPSGE